MDFKSSRCFVLMPKLQIKRFLFFVFVLLFNSSCLVEAVGTKEGKVPSASSYVSLSVAKELRISDNPTLLVNEKQPVTLVCQFSTVEGARLREVVWYREFEDGTSVKLVTYDAIMNITQVNTIAQENVNGLGPTSILINAASPTDDGWYQCHVGVYVSNNIVEKIGYIYLNVLVPPSDVFILAPGAIEENQLLRHNFSLVCRVERSKPAADLIFTRNGLIIPEQEHINSSGLIEEMAGTLGDLIASKDFINMNVVITTGNIDLSGSWDSDVVPYTMIHIKAQIAGTKLWESSSYLLWTLRPEHDTNAEYGCQAQHESLDGAKTAERVLSMFVPEAPREDWLVIDTKPSAPVYGDNVILQLRSQLLENLFPRPVLLWTNNIGSIANGKKFFVGNKLYLRKAYQNNTVYKVQAFNALGTASTTKKLVLKKRPPGYKSSIKNRNNASTMSQGKEFLMIFVTSFAVLFSTYLL
uniref:immunoglobulin superfamily member 21-like isoform X2 n=1 Tax=Ciona intestinalis TaxID=7719 RepID=UPI000EF514A8|nr:immunoglobulin superfamily member 21-like isoform X2 [Ciona intestinalis]|eukprot:XP_018667322.2 immunoglobulin superfamily member 21-like isoform X2 [Ciona intestinalis]